MAFNRPASFMRTSGYEIYDGNTLFSLNMGSEILSVGSIVSHNSSFAINRTNSNGTNWGFSYTALPYTGTDEAQQSNNLATELGVHIQKNIYNTGKTNIMVGVHDLLIDDDQTISITDLSFFVNFSNTLSVSNYTLSSLLGIGSGKLAFDPHTIAGPSTTPGLYAALKLKTPFLDYWGGVDFITEFVYQGFNIGLTIPFTKEYALSFGITHAENLGEFSRQSDNDNPQDLLKDSPGLCIGLTVNIPSIKNQQIRKIAQDYPLLFINGQVDSSLFNAGQYIYFLQDSLSLLKQDIHLLSSQNVGLTLNNQDYQDSLNNLLFTMDKNNNTHNKAMRHLSKSLRFYYQGDFKQALNEVDKAIELQPNTAIAYARKGSIYYKLNQLDRATLNWNIALKLDPEYSEVREMLNALKNNKLKPLSADK